MITKAIEYLEEGGQSQKLVYEIIVLVFRNHF